MLKPNNNKELYNKSNLEKIVKLEWITKKWISIINEYQKENQTNSLNINWNTCKMNLMTFLKIFWNAFLNSRAYFKIFFENISISDSEKITNDDMKIKISKILSEWNFGKKFLTPNYDSNYEEIDMTKRVLIKTTGLWSKVIESYIKRNAGKNSIAWKINKNWNNIYEMMFLELTKIFGNWFRASESNYKIFFEEFWFVDDFPNIKTSEKIKMWNSWRKYIIPEN